MKALIVIFLAASCSASAAAQQMSARDLVDQAIEYWRGKSSSTKAEMTVHRSDWERTMSFSAWMSGKEKSLVRFTSPAKDAGNASLTLDNEMWSFTPRINRIIKIPSSMMEQSWMGSDFSYNDLAKSADIIDQYEHSIKEERVEDGKKVYLVESVPNESAPVVWGKEELTIREDFIILEHKFYDQDMKLVKRLRALELGQLGGRLYATVIRMEDLESVGEWTEIKHTFADFDIDVPPHVFTLSNLRNPRE